MPIKTTSQLENQLTQTESNRSLFETEINQHTISSSFKALTFQKADSFSSLSTAIKQAFPKTLNHHKNQLLTGENNQIQPITNKRIAVLFSGGPAAGGHNVLAGIFKALGDQNTLLGVKRGPKGLLSGDLFEITQDHINKVSNLGGFDLLGTDRTKIKTAEQFNAVEKTVVDHHLNAIIIIGGDDSNTNAALLAEQLFDRQCAVIGVPKTIDGDLQVNDHLPISFGFDTATKTYAELVGNILQDTRSSLKYWHFVKLMGRSASQVTLEVALQTKPAITLISEEIANNASTLDEIVTKIANVVTERAKNGIHHGVVLIPEGLIEFIPEFKSLVNELNDAIAQGHTQIHNQQNKALFETLPTDLQNQLLADRDSHGNLQVSLIQTEKLLIELVRNKLKNTSIPFSAHHHFFGYEGRCGTPTVFDAWYCYNLGIVAGALALSNHTGYMASISKLDEGGVALAIPLAGLITNERRDGYDTLVIKKALVKLDSPAFKYFKSREKTWAETDVFSSPGPRQFWGPTAHQLPFTVALNQSYRSYTMTV